MTDTMQTIEQVLVTGDLTRFTAEQKIIYYERLCDSLGLNKLTKPFEYLSLQGKLVLYATKNCGEQLRQLHGVSITNLSGQRIEDVYIVTATAIDKHGRTDCATGAVGVANLRNDALCNAYMKAETKSKRRVTLSLCSLGMLDETELETIAGARIVPAIELSNGTHQKAVEALAPANDKGIVNLQGLCNWAVDTFPKSFENDEAVKSELRRNGIVKWNKDTSIQTCISIIEYAAKVDVSGLA